MISKKEIQDLIQHKSKYCLIDVRSRTEHKISSIETSKLIPLQEFSDAFGLEEDDFEDSYGFKKPKKEELVIVYCRSGIRSAVAAQIAEEFGYNK
jgi:rhodanese-related sulfurtransferase